jgi:hypothetical protein
MLRYAELALHRLIDYRGQHANQFGATMTGDVESVPWTSPVAPIENPCKKASFVVTVGNVIVARAANNQNRDARKAVHRRRRRREPAGIVMFG